MSHCYSVGVNINGEEREVCTTHVPGNEGLSRDIELGKPRKPTKDEVNRAIDYWKKNPGKHYEPGMPKVFGEY